MSVYDTNLTDLKRNIIAQKTIYRFRNFLYSINKDIRHHWFDMCRNYLENERQNPIITATEKDRLQSLITHWEWNSFENTSTNWWYILSMNHSHSLTLMTLLHLWIDDVEIFDSEAFETSTMGLR
jgi:hypothetical protein